MHSAWFTSYPEGMPQQIDVEAFQNVGQILERSAARFANHPAFANQGTTLTYAEVEALSRAFGAYLQHDLRLDRGDRVAVMLPNLLQYPVAVFGILRAGLTVVNVNPLYTARELRYQLQDSGARAIVILENFAHTLAEVLGSTPIEHVVTTGLGDLLGRPKSLLINLAVKHIKRLVPSFDLPRRVPFGRALARGKRHPLDAIPSGHEEDVAFLQYTGGTTGIAKAALLTHRNVIANVQQACAWFCAGPHTARSLTEGREVVITALPLYHIFALTANCMMFVRIGGLNYLITNPRDLKGFVREIRKLAFTTITGVDTLFNGLLNTPGFAAVDFSRCKFALGGGMPVQCAVAERWHQITGTPLVEAYGLTESSPAVCVNRVDIERFTGAVGLPLPSTECCIRDDQGNELGCERPGELSVRGPQVMRGYWQRPEATAEVLSEDGWLRTGDIATMDDRGYFRIVDRKKDVILVSGFNVYPAEIEGVVASHPGVLEVGAIGIPDADTGEAVKVVVVRKDPELTAETLRRFCGEQLTGYKIPGIVEFRTELPKSSVGKILRRALRSPTPD